MRLTRVAGFTLVEIMVAVLTGSIVILAAGTMLFYGYRAWRDSTRAVDVQRDASAVVELASRLLREASGSDVTVGTGRIEIAPPGGTAMALYERNGDFVFDPDTSASGDEQTMVRGKVASFVPTGYSEGMTFLLVLADGNASTRVDTILAYRNAD